MNSWARVAPLLVLAAAAAVSAAPVESSRSEARDAAAAAATTLPGTTPHSTAASTDEGGGSSGKGGVALLLICLGATILLGVLACRKLRDAGKLPDGCDSVSSVVAATTAKLFGRLGRGTAVPTSDPAGDPYGLAMPLNPGDASNPYGDEDGIAMDELGLPENIEPGDSFTHADGSLYATAEGGDEAAGGGGAGDADFSAVGSEFAYTEYED